MYECIMYELNYCRSIYLLRYSKDRRWTAKSLSLKRPYPASFFASLHVENTLYDKYILLCCFVQLSVRPYFRFRPELSRFPP